MTCGIVEWRRKRRRSLVRMRRWRAALAVVGLLALCAVVPAALPAATTALTPEAGVAALVDEAAGGTADLEDSLRHLTGVVTTTVDGRTRRIWTRHADSGTPVVTAQQYVHGRLQAFGVKASFQRYGDGAGRRNVVGEIRGSLEPARVVLISAHLDDMPASGPAPGADDNGSGCAALLYLAKHLAGHRFDRTLRFVFFGGEEIGAQGSAFAAERSRRAGEDIVAVLNVDAVGWNGRETRVLEVHRRQAGTAPGSGDDLVIAKLLEQVVTTYDMDIRVSDKADALSWRDHASLRSQG